MVRSHRYANYPTPKEAPASALALSAGDEDKNPAIRGYTLVLAASLVAGLGSLQKFLWSNAKFGKPATVPGLEKELPRLDPTVIPLSDGHGPESMLELGQELTERQPADLGGRFHSIADYYALYQAGKVTPLQVAEALLSLVRRDIGKPSKYAVAWIHIHPEKVLAAAKASTERWAAGKPLGLLDGVPFGVKDDTDVRGYVSSSGMRLNSSEPFFAASKEATTWPVRKLEEAGAVMIGKMNQHEVGMDTTGCNPSTGTPTNWYNKSYYPGGSSSGAASALCGGVVPIAVGTDGGGSTRIPPAFCGVYGLKTSHSRTVVTGSSVMTIGPMASTVSDLAIAYRVMSQPDPEDSTQGLFAISTPPDPSEKKYIGIWKEWLAKADPEVREVYDKALYHLTSQGGYELVDISLPYMREGALAHSATCLTEVADMAKSRTKDPRNWLSLMNPPNRILVAVGSQTPATDFLKYGQLRQVLMSHLAFLFKKYPGLLIVTPTTPMPGWTISPGDEVHGFTDGNKSMFNMIYVWIANVAGLPAVTCPAGYIDPVQGEGKVPISIMATGEWGAEEQLLGFARETETYLHEVYPGGRLRPEEWLDVLAVAQEEAQTAARN